MNDFGRGRVALIVSILVGAAVVAVLVWGVAQLLSSGDEPDEPVATPSGGVSASPSPSPSVTAGPVPEPSAPELPSGDADLVVTSASWDDAAERIELSGYVNGVIEMDGLCTLTVVGPVVREATRAGVPNVTNTSCGELEITRDDLVPGTYSVTLSYDSPSTSGTSESTEVVVP